MGLFQKKPQVSSSAPLYTLGLSKTVLVVGLGNIGKDYVGTRHNIGFECVDAFALAHEFSPWVDKKDLKCQQTDGNIGGTRVIVIKPTTFMNLSGQAVQATMHFYKVSNSDILVIHDELDLPFGQIRSRVGGSSAGNNGVESIIGQIGDDFARIRIGIDSDRPAKQDGADFVLGKFGKTEATHLPDLKKEVTSLITEFVAGGELPHDTRTWLIKD